VKSIQLHGRFKSIQLWKINGWTIREKNKCLQLPTSCTCKEWRNGRHETHNTTRDTRADFLTNICFPEISFGFNEFSEN
jgi:hypothetical protein